MSSKNPLAEEQQCAFVFFVITLSPTFLPNFTQVVSFHPSSWHHYFFALDTSSTDKEYELLISRTAMSKYNTQTLQWTVIIY
jgi:hypothetical protein